MSYTPGPWHVCREEFDPDNGVFHICTPSDRVIAEIDYDWCDSTKNAYLIASAPEMWELLLDMYNDMDVEIPSKYLDRLTGIRTKIEEGESFGD